MKPVLPVAKGEFLGCVIVKVDDYFNPSSYPKNLPAGFKGPQCEFCGKPIKDPKPWHVTGVNGNIIWICSVDDAEKMMNEDGDFMGAIPIGPECGRKVRKAIADIGLDPDKYVIRLEVIS